MHSKGKYNQPEVKSLQTANQAWIKQSYNLYLLLEELNSRKSIEKPAVAVAWQ